MQATGKFTAFANRDFRLFWFGQIISLSGTWMQSVAQGWLVYSLTKSPLYLGIVAAASSLPILLFTLVGGVVADRFPKRSILLLTQALSIFPALILGVLTSLGVITVWQVAVLAFFLGTINALDIPTRQSFLMEMVGRDHIMNAVALNSAAFHGARVIGPTVAGFAISWLGIPACFFLNAASFIAVIIALMRMKSRGDLRVGKASIFSDLMKGVNFIRGSREIMSVIALVAVFGLIGIPYITLLPVVAAEVFHQGARGFGFLVGASGIGALAAAIFLAARGDVGNRMRFMSASAVSFSLSVLLFSLSRSFPLSLVIVMVAGWGMVSYMATANSHIQLSVPDELRGRVMSIFSLLFLGSAPIGNSLMGLAASAFGTTNVIMISGMICLGASLVARRFFVVSGTE